MRRITYVVLLAFLIALIPGSILVSASETKPPIPVHIADRDFISAGSFDCWLHADGKTWQDTDFDGEREVPGDGKTQYCIFTFSIPEDLKAQYDNVTYKIIPFHSEMSDSEMQTLFDRAGGFAGSTHPDYTLPACSTYDKFEKEILEYRPDNYKIKDGTTDTTEFLFPEDPERALNVKKDWQLPLVQGRRALMPALVEFWGTPKKQEPPKPKEPQKKGCVEQPSVTNTWEELYEWQVYHPGTCTDEEGNEYDCSYWEDKSAIVTYTETLSATLTVNTKQGIATDPKRPKESDRESRGSWEIIPWARKNGLNPNEVTRAGYGFEVKVETEYTNDWENKVPAGASPKGGKFNGPNSVEVEFYDTKGNFVLRKSLTPTRGKIDSQNVTWELPS